MRPGAGEKDDWIAFQRIQEVKSAAQINLVRFVSVVFFFQYSFFCLQVLNTTQNKLATW